MTHSSLIGKIEKARLYAQEPRRMKFSHFVATFQGEHDTHTVHFKSSDWDCTCHYFSQHKVCSHVMAAQRILKDMLPSGV